MELPEGLGLGWPSLQCIYVHMTSRACWLTELPEGLGLGWPYLQCIYAHMTRQSLLADGVARRTRTRMAISAMYLCTHDQAELAG